MALPDYQTLMLPLLRLAGDRQEHRTSEAVERLSDEFGLTDAERAELLPSGSQTYIQNRVRWASTYLRKAGLLEATRRGHVRITPRGEEVLKQNIPELNVKFLKRYPEFLAFHNAAQTGDSASDATLDENNEDSKTPVESLETAVQRLRGELAAELLAKVKTTTPEFFEKLVVTLLLAMGYGGSRAEAGRAIGKSGDGGIDGIIDEDRLGLDAVYIQAKRWDKGTIGRPEIQKFVGALHGQRARKGVFITTSTFSADAIDYAGRVENRVVLIDGHRLANLMIDFGVGVSVEATHVIKKIDNDFFEE